MMKDKKVEDVQTSDGSQKEDHAKPQSALPNEEASIKAMISGEKPKKTISSELINDYHIEGNNEKGKYFYIDSPDVVAFKDSGKKLTTKSTSKAVAKSMVVLAETKNWESIKLSGTDNFKKEAWMEASLRGIEVTGFSPSEQDLQNLKQQQNKIEKAEKERDKESINSDLRIKTLTNAYINLTRIEATRQFPELIPLYKLEKASLQFVEHPKHHDKFDEKGKKLFITTIRDRGLSQLSRGEKLPDLKDQTKESTKTVERTIDIER